MRSTQPDPAVHAAGATRRGAAHERNEDAFAILAGGRLLVVADGLGGHGGGDRASGAVVEAFAAAEERLLRGDPSSPPRLLVQALGDAAGRIAARVRDGAPRDAGTTVVAAHVAPGGRATILNLGDSRCYLLRDGRLHPVTRDHSLVHEFGVRTGALTREEARRDPHAGVLTRYLGAGGPEGGTPELHRVRLRAGDRLLLCTDGVTDPLPEDELERLLRAGGDAAALLVAAVAAGGRDDVTAIVAEVTAPVETRPLTP
jgi:serine/threonine protein phosphatase PrpC